ncbi:MAG TPA: putative toxin-antitoxin system toxin component, PIN family [Rhodocyclaceae bacterium]|nr:putative toxin-antitoxin system toxin component, PIN family [Rhodocyclaceae bacterium]
MRLVLDTNVVLSLWVFSDSRFAPLQDLVRAGRLIALTSPDCLAEFERVLGYPEFKLEAEKRRRILADYAATVQRVAAAGQAVLDLPQCRDGDDQKFLELARDGRADYLLTSDKALLKLARHRRLSGRFRIVTPECFMNELE